MANITPRTNKDGEIISYRIRVAKGYDSYGKKLKPYELSWKPDPGMTSKQIEKELNKQAVQFEDQCKKGLTGDGGKVKFAEYSEHVLKAKTDNGELKHHTLIRYKELLRRINAGIGHLKLVEIRPAHLNAFYEQLQKSGIRYGCKAILKVDTDLKTLIKEKYTNRESFAKDAGVAYVTINKAIKGESIEYSCSQKIADALVIPVTKLFNVVKDNTPLSVKTVIEHHRLISVILHEAEREMLVPYNAAEKAKPPKATKTKVKYFEPEEVSDIIVAAESQPLKWKLIIHLMLVTGGRRGELLGLRWSEVDWNFNKIHITACIYYEADIGIYFDIPKTEKSDRYVKLPGETMEMLKEYKQYYDKLVKSAGSQWSKVVEVPDGKGIIQKLNNDFIFVQENKNIGFPMHPDTVTSYCNIFSEKNGLPHIYPHAFRHTAASLLYFNGVDSVSISNYLGHAKVSTTQDIYSHVIEESQSRIAETLGEVIFTKKLSRNKDSDNSNTHDDINPEKKIG